MPHAEREHELMIEIARLTKERDEARAGLHRAEVELRVSGAAYGSLQDSLTVARREVEAHKEALSDLMKLINEGALVRNIGQDGEPGWTLRAMRLVMALKHAYALVPELAAPGPAPGEETKR